MTRLPTLFALLFLLSGCFSSSGGGDATDGTESDGNADSDQMLDVTEVDAYLPDDGPPEVGQFNFAALFVSSYNFGLRKGSEAVRTHTEAGDLIEHFVVTDDRRWLAYGSTWGVEYGGRQRFANMGLASVLDDLAANGTEIQAMDISPSDHWMVVTADEVLTSDGFPVDDLVLAVGVALAADNPVDDIALGPDDSWAAVFDGDLVLNEVPLDMQSWHDDIELGQRHVTEVSVSTRGWIIVARDWFVFRISGGNTLDRQRLRDGLTEMAENNASLIDRVRGTNLFTNPNGTLGFHILSRGFHATADDVWTVAENNMTGSCESIYEHMDLRGVPGATVALIDDGEVLGIRSYGVRDPASPGNSMAPGDLFQVASTSKMVAAFGVAAAIDDGFIDGFDTTMGEIAGANPTSIVGRWVAADPMAPGTPRRRDVTFHQLLSHTSGLNLHGIGSGDPDSNAWITLNGIVMGDASNPNNTGVDFIPGHTIRGQFDYSGGGYSLAQAALQAAVGQGFAIYMKRRVLDRIGMIDSTFGRNDNELLTGFHPDGAGNYTSQIGYCWGDAAGGLLSTAHDMSLFVITMLNGGVSPLDGSQVVSSDLVDQLLTYSSFRGDADNTSCSSSAECTGAEFCRIRPNQVTGRCGLALVDADNTNGNVRHYAKGLDMSSVPDANNFARTYEHGGTNPGFRAKIKFSHSLGLTLNGKSGFVLLTNQSNSDLPDRETAVAFRSRFQTSADVALGYGGSNACP